jgi:hypothetical protein
VPEDGHDLAVLVASEPIPVTPIPLRRTPLDFTSSRTTRLSTATRARACSPQDERPTGPGGARVDARRIFDAKRTRERRIADAIDVRADQPEPIEAAAVDARDR